MRFPMCLLNLPARPGHPNNTTHAMAMVDTHPARHLARFEGAGKISVGLEHSLNFEVRVQNQNWNTGTPHKDMHLDHKLLWEIWIQISN